MRKDHYLPPAKWTRQFRQALRLSDVHLKVYAYLLPDRKPIKFAKTTPPGRRQRVIRAHSVVN